MSGCLLLEICIQTCQSFYDQLQTYVGPSLEMDAEMRNELVHETGRLQRHVLEILARYRRLQAQSRATILTLLRVLAA